MIWRNIAGKKSMVHGFHSSLISKEVMFEQSYALHGFNTPSVAPLSAHSVNQLPGLPGKCCPKEFSTAVETIYNFCPSPLCSFLTIYGYWALEMLLA